MNKNPKNTKITEVESDYREYILDLANSDRNVVFYNSGPQHGAFVLATIFSKAENNIKIFNGGFSGEISSDRLYQENLLDFLVKGGKLEILCNQNEVKKSDFFNLLAFYNELIPGSITVKQTTTIVTKGDTENAIHFAVADNKMYRVEDDIDNYTAFCNFNDPEQAQILSSLFDGIFNNEDHDSTPVDLSNKSQSNTDVLARR